MNLAIDSEYCAFTKAVEHLGDRWSLLIIREIARFGPRGFNALATGLPGHVSRSVLAAKLRKLEEIGLLARDPSENGRAAPYVLTPAGEQLVPTLKSLWDWAEHWIPEDAAMAQRDPAVILWWLRHRVDRDAAPEQQVAIELDMRVPGGERTWLLVARGAEPNLCLEDPLLGDERYLYVEADPAGLLAVARGARSWAEAIDDGSVSVFGPPALVGELSSWFLPPEPARMPAPVAV